MEAQETQSTHSKSLDFILKQQSELIEADIKRMYNLMEANYDHVNYEIFTKDLNNKQYVGLLFDDKNIIQGFTTFSINPKESGTKEYSIIFSGDTIISPAYWGTQEMMRGWCISVGKMIATDNSKKWYWFLLSKGHRTYMYLPLFFNDYYPSINGRLTAQIKKKIDESAAKIYSRYYKPESGIITFGDNMGELKPELAKATFDKQHKPHIKLFLEKNPEFYKGDELVCMAQIHPDNMRGYALKFVLEGMEQKLPGCNL